MSTEELNYYKAAASLNLIPEEDNPIFLFSQTSRDILLDIVNKKIDVVELAKMEIKNRGIDIYTGRFIGWKTENWNDKGQLKRA